MRETASERLAGRKCAGTAACWEWQKWGMANMPTVISMLRGVNLGRSRRIRMDDLRALYESLKLRDVRTHLQSGNVVFRTPHRDLSGLTRRLEREIERKFGFHSDVIVRTVSEMKEVVARNPFAHRRGIDPSRLLVTFLAGDPGEKAREAVRRIRTDPEELHIEGRELYIYFPNGMGRSNLPGAAIEKALDTPGTARNWNSVTKLLQIAESQEALRED
jgi:uncharacterized protein (DUF1697 family)